MVAAVKTSNQTHSPAGEGTPALEFSPAARIKTADDRRAPLSAFLKASVRHPGLSALALAIIYVLSFSTLTVLLFRYFGFPLDDSYIHQTVARNLARFGTLGFNAHQRSSGATSLLWTLIQAANLRFLHLNPVIYNVLLSYLFLACTGPLLFLMAVRDRMRPLVCWIVALSPALLGNYLWLGMIGMEHLLFVDLSLAAIYFWLTPRSTGELSGRSALIAGLSAGLLSVTRPETIVFAPLLLGSARIIAGLRRSRRDLVLFLAPWAALTAAMLGTSIYTSHALMPATLHGRRWLYFHTSGGAFTIASKLRFCGAWIQRLPRQFSPSHTHQLTHLRDLRSLSAVLGVFFFALALMGAAYLIRRKPVRIGLLCGWAALHFFLYFFTFPASGHGGRYQPLTLLLLLPFMMLGIYQVAEFLLRSHREGTFAVMAVAMVLAGLASLHTWRRVTAVGISHISNTHGQVAKWMNANLSPDVTFAAFDIGRVSWDWKGETIDLGGLVDPTYYRYLQTHRVGDYLRERHVQYVMLPNKGTEDMGLDNLRGSLLVEYCSPPADWLLGFRYTIHATPCQLLYRLSSPSDSPAVAAQLTTIDAASHAGDE